MVYYAVYYSTKDSGRVKNYAGEDKVDYICKAINDVGEKVLLLSNAKTTEKRFAKRERLNLYQNTDLLYFASLPRRGIVLHAIDVLWGYIQLFLYVLFKVKQTDTIIVYHSLGYRGLWGILRKIKKFNYILEVEELFQTFEASNSSYKKHERKVFKYPDAFLFSNALLAEDINTANKPYAIINGIYKGSNVQKRSDGFKVRVIYAGSLEKQKGVDYIIPVASHLPDQYEIRIIGFGSNNDIDRIKNLIKMAKGNVSYDGVFKGEEYTRYLQSCDIGLCIQDENDKFNKFEYPSKIFSYLTNGLQVVANELIQLKNSDVFPYLHIASSKEPKDIAEAILKCERNCISANEILCKLDEHFKEQLKMLLWR